MSASRHGIEWSYEDYRTLVASVRDGLDVPQLAALLGRSPGGIEAALSRLVPAGLVRAPRVSVLAWLREQLADPAYPWLAMLRGRYGSTLSGPWTPTDDQLLLLGWQAGSALPAIAAQLEIAEQLVARRLVKLGVAQDVCEVVDRIGCIPGGEVEARARLARDRAGFELFILVVVQDGAQYVSLHASQEAAEAAVPTAPPATVEAEASAQVAAADPAREVDRRRSCVRWAIVCRVPGGSPARLRFVKAA